MAKNHKPRQGWKPGERLDTSQRLKTRFPEFEASWNRTIHEVGHELVNFIQEKIQGSGSLLTNLANFRFKFVVDNNFVFGQIKGAIEKNRSIEKSFIYKLLASRSIQIYAPPKLKDELLDKINLVLTPEQRGIAMGYALMILSRIEVKDAQWIDHWKRAHNLIGEIDEDDVPYLALALEIEGHAIMSFDEVFHRQGDVRVWKHRDADQVITNYNSGFISFVLMNQAGALLGNLLSVVFKFIWDLLKQVVEVLMSIADGVIKTLAKIPAPFWILIIGLGFLFREELAKSGKDLISYLKEKGNEILVKLKEAVAEIYKLLKGFLEVAALTGTISFEFLGYLVQKYNEMNTQLKDLKITPQVDVTPLPNLKQA